jgi:hypothetical protein
MKYPIFFDTSYSPDMAWLSQANHVFSRLGITSNFEDYGMSLLPVGLYNNLSTQFYCLGSALRSRCPQLYHTHPKATYLFARTNSSILDFHCHPNGQNVRPIGLGIHRVLNSLVGRMQLVLAFQVSEFWSMRWDGHGMPACMKDSVSSTRPKALIQTARSSLCIWGSHCINCLARQALHLPIVSR